MGSMMVTYRLLFILSIFFPLTIHAQCSLTPDSENVVGTQLAGDWQINVDLTTQLWPDYLTWVGVTSVSFTDNPSIVDMLPEEDCGSWMNDLGQLFLAGEMTFTMEQETVSFPYVLASSSGNPHLVYWTQQMTDVESFNLMIARAEDKNKDMLFIGGDFNNQPFTAWTRMEI